MTPETDVITRLRRQVTGKEIDITTKLLRQVAGKGTAVRFDDTDEGMSGVDEVNRLLDGGDTARLARALRRDRQRRENKLQGKQ